MDRFPGYLVLAGAIMIAGGANSPDDKGVIAMAIGCIVAVMGLVIGYYALRAMAEGRRAQDHD